MYTGDRFVFPLWLVLHLQYHDDLFSAGLWYRTPLFCDAIFFPLISCLSRQNQAFTPSHIKSIIPIFREKAERVCIPRIAL